MERVGVVGLGTMGGAMAANLARAGFPLVVWNRTAGRTRELEELGATVAETPAALAARSDVVLVCVSDTDDVEAVLFGVDGVAAGAGPGTLVVDCSTNDPGASRDLAERLARQGVGFVDAPVTGGSEGARSATLAILVGGAAADVERARPVLEAIGRTVTHFGPVGAGQAAKAVNQVILAGTNDYPLGFRVALHLKDLGIALDLARSTGTVLPVAALAAQLESGLVAAGHGDDDMSALARPVRALSGLEG